MDFEKIWFHILDGNLFLKMLSFSEAIVYQPQYFQLPLDHQDLPCHFWAIQYAKNRWEC